MELGKKRAEKMRALFLFAFLVCGNLFAQISAEESYVGFFAPSNPDAPERMDRWMVDLFADRWNPLPQSINTKPFSGGIAVARMMDLPLSKKSTFAIALGFGFASHNIHSNGFFEERINSVDNVSYHITPLDSNYEYRKNKISLNYLEIPFQLRFRSAKKWNFFFYPGFKAGWLINDHTKTIDKDGKYKLYNFKGFEKLQYGPTVHLGFNRFAVYGYYSLTNILKNGDAFNQISIGISLNFF